MEPMDAETASLDEIWKQVFDLVRREIDVATVWLAMQAVKPLVIDGSFFVATLPLESQFLVINLQSVLAFRLIEGQTVADWEREKQRASAVPPSRPSASSAPPPTSRPKASAGDAPRSSGPAREVFTTWEKLNERLTHGYKAAPFMKYPQGQAGYIMLCVAHISDTMDLFMPGPGQPRDEAQERTLAKTLERLGSVVNLDPLFIGLELIRFRRAEGKDVGF
jgi:hypothetical protein